MNWWEKDAIDASHQAKIEASTSMVESSSISYDEVRVDVVALISLTKALNWQLAQIRVLLATMLVLGGGALLVALIS